MPITRGDPIQCELLYPRSPSTPIPRVEICSLPGSCAPRIRVLGAGTLDTQLRARLRRESPKEAYKFKGKRKKGLFRQARSGKSLYVAKRFGLFSEIPLTGLLSLTGY